MSGNIGTQFWITYAGNDVEAWKCVGLARSLKRTLTTRPLGVICSSNVSSDAGFLLQSEFQLCHRINPRDEKYGKGLNFRTAAKLYAQKLPDIKHFIFLDCNCLALKNIDVLFRKSGAHWVDRCHGGFGYAAIIIKERSTKTNHRRGLIESICAVENGLEKFDQSCREMVIKESKFQHCLEIGLDLDHPFPMTGDDVRMVCFINGTHPCGNPGLKLQKRNTFEHELLQFWKSLGMPDHPILDEQMNLTLPSPINEVQRLSTSEITNSIAIVGMSCKYPGANTIDEYWTMLENGIDGIVRVPEWRWTKENSFITMDDVRKTEAGFLSCPVDMFDAKFFNTNQADMAYLDPQQRLALKVVWEALEHARIDAGSLKNSLTGVYGGWWRNDYKEMLQQLGLQSADFLRLYMGNALGPLTARISHFFELIGPAFSTESGCSTSVAGVDMACDSLRNETSDLGIAVGINLLLHPFSLANGLMEGVLAPDGRCKTFDSDANGFGRAEGAGVLILKRYSDAVADGDRIWGLIRGSAVVQEGTSRSMGTPTVNVEAKAMELALHRAGVHPHDVNFVETHGTGTPVGDPIEVAAIAKIYGGRQPDNRLIIGSVKTNIGHTESVCGIAGIQKSVLCMANEKITRHLHLKSLNPEIHIDDIPATIPMENTPWIKNQSKPRIAGINSFGITGAQAHVIVQEPPIISGNTISLHDTRALKLLTFSAKNPTALAAQVEQYKSFLRSTKTNLGDIEYTMHTGRSHFPLRHIAIGSSKEDIVNALGKLAVPIPIPNVTPKLCFLFTGQGSQYPGMGKDLYEQNVVFRSNFDRLEFILQSKHGFSIKEQIWNPNPEVSGLQSTLHSQVSIFCIEICLMRLWESWGIKPDAVLGHSLGECAATVACGMMDVEDALNIVVTRSKLIDKLPHSAMFVVEADLTKAMQIMESAGLNKLQRMNGPFLDIAAVNSQTQTVVSGDTNLVQQFKSHCDNQGLRTKILNSAHAFHSRCLNPILKEYAQLVDTIKFKPQNPNISFISSVEGCVVSRLDTNYWIKHTQDRVKFLESSLTAIENGYNIFLEVGPHPVLSTLVLENSDGSDKTVSVLPSLRRNTSEWATILTSLGRLYTSGSPITWDNFHRFTLSQKADVPGYTFEETSHWLAIQDSGTTPFHPLVGSYFPCASEVTIFQSLVNVSSIPFLKDHVIMDKIVFPAVGYIDMCMTAGYTSSQCEKGSYKKPTTSIGVQNFAIHSPLALSPTLSTEFQIVVSKSPEGEKISTIYTKLFLDKSEYKWVRNASAMFTFQPGNPDPNISNFSEIRDRVCEPLKESIDYAKLQENSDGFKFGPSCQTVGKQAWKNPLEENEYIVTFKCHESEENMERFIIHPWVIDPMLQTQIASLGLMNRSEIDKGNIVVPVMMEKFIWWGHSAPSGYIYNKHSASGNESHLYDEDGKLMASMIGTEFVQTTLNNILSMIDSQKNPYPSMAEFSWKEKLGSAEKRIPDKKRGLVRLQELITEDNNLDKFTESEQALYNNSQQLAGLHILRTMKDLGIDNHHKLEFPILARIMKIVPEFESIFRYMLLELEKDGYLCRIGNTDPEMFCFEQNQILPDISQTNAKISKIVEECREAGHEWISRMSEFCNYLPRIVTGEQKMELTNPNLGEQELKEWYYSESLFAAKTKELQLRVQTTFLKQLTAVSEAKCVIRILEVGTGMKSTTETLIAAIIEVGVEQFDITYAASSAEKMVKGESVFLDKSVPANFVVLKIDEDPISQGMIPGYFDVIITSWAMRGPLNRGQTLENLKTLLKPNGYIQLLEQVKPGRELSLISEIFVHSNSPKLELPDWKILHEHGFEDFAAFETYEKSISLTLSKVGSNTPNHIQRNFSQPPKTCKWLLFADDDLISNQVIEKMSTIFSLTVVHRKDLENSPLEMEEAINKSITNNISDTVGIMYLWGLTTQESCKSACEPLLYICKYLSTSTRPGSIRFMSITKGCMCIGPTDYKLECPTASPIVAMVQVLANEVMDVSCKSVDIDSSDSAAKEIFTELFQWDEDTIVAYRSGKRCTPRLKKYKAKTSALDIPHTPKSRLIIPSTHAISDLRFASYELEPPKDCEVGIEVKAYALNFLDVLMVTKPDSVFDEYNYLGVDIAGIVTAIGPGCTKVKVGDRVGCIRNAGVAMPSHYVAPNEDSVLPIANNMTYSDVVTFPLAMITVLYSLARIAKATPEDTILIHTASGAVGIQAIQFAQKLGCTIVVTAGNDRKRNYLRSMGLKHVFNSRTTEYAQKAREALGGKGVTIVLNSLTGAGFKEATLSLCENGARFVEISKMNIWSKQEIQQLRQDVVYEVVDVSLLPDSELRMCLQEIRSRFTEVTSRRPLPCPYTSFESWEIREALEYLEKVKHIGKVVIRMPELGIGASETRFKLFNAEATYLITGGLGGIGLEVAKWMVQSGAEHLILVGRSPPNPETLQIIKFWE